jgi:hypothetical protein
MKIYKIGSNRYLEDVLELPDTTKGIPLGYTRKSPPNTVQGEYVYWAGNQWVITNISPNARNIIQLVTETVDDQLEESQNQENINEDIDETTEETPEVIEDVIIIEGTPVDSAEDDNSNA